LQHQIDEAEERLRFQGRGGAGFGGDGAIDVGLVVLRGQGRRDRPGPVWKSTPGVSVAPTWVETTVPSSVAVYSTTATPFSMQVAARYSSVDEESVP
jgi:hypothetical protein